MGRADRPLVAEHAPLRIAIVSQYYKPENAKIPNSLAESLASRGHDVRVVTGYPNYPEGRLYPGYRQKLFHLENDGLVQVRRVPMFLSHSQNALNRFANYMTFAFSSLTAVRFIRDADVVYVYATQMTAAIAPAVWNRSLRLPFVLHVQDLWPESVTGSAMVRAGISKRVINAVLKPWLQFMYRRASAIVAIAPTMTKMLLDRGVESAKLHTVLNWDSSILPVETGARLQRAVEHSGFSVIYAGNLGELQDLQTVVRAAAKVSDLNGFRISLVGAGIAENELRTLVQELGATNVEFVGAVSQSGMREVYEQSDFQLVTLKDLPIFRGTIPSKLQGSLAHGTPVITTVAGDVSDIVRENGLGFTSKPGDADALAEEFRRAYETSEDEMRAMRGRARRYYDAEMSMEQGVDRIETILHAAALAGYQKKRNR